MDIVSPGPLTQRLAKILPKIEESSTAGPLTQRLAKILPKNDGTVDRLKQRSELEQQLNALTEEIEQELNLYTIKDFIKKKRSVDYFTFKNLFKLHMILLEMN